MEECQPSLNERTTELHVSNATPKLCCFCIPHTLGLFILALIKLVLSLAILILILLILFLILIFSELYLFYYIIVLAGIAIVINLVDIFIGLVAMVSICMKDHGMLEMYYKYTIYVFGSLTVLCCVISYSAGIHFFSPSSSYVLSRHVIPMSILISIFLPILVLQVCLNQMVKREILILRSKEQFLL